MRKSHAKFVTLSHSGCIRLNIDFHWKKKYIYMNYCYAVVANTWLKAIPKQLAQLSWPTHPPAPSASTLSNASLLLLLRTQGMILLKSPLHDCTLWPGPLCGCDGCWKLHWGVNLREAKTLRKNTAGARTASAGCIATSKQHFGFYRRRTPLPPPLLPPGLHHRGTIPLCFRAEGWPKSQSRSGWLLWWHLFFVRTEKTPISQWHVPLFCVKNLKN